MRCPELHPGGHSQLSEYQIQPLLPARLAMLTSVMNIRLRNMLSRVLRTALLISVVSTPLLAQLAPSPGEAPTSTAPDTTEDPEGQRQPG